MIIDKELISSEITRLKDRSWVDYAGLFSKLAGQSLDDKQRNAYEIIHAVCMLSYYDEDEPYGPFFLPAGSKCELDLTIEQYDVLSELVVQIEDAKLRARVADLLWICGKKTKGKSEFKFAKIAVDSFANLDINEKSWFLEGLDRDWRRALRLVTGLSKGVPDAYEKMKRRLFDAFLTASKSGDVNNLLRWAIPSLLAEMDLLEIIPAIQVADALEKLTDECRTAGDSEYYVQVYARAAAEWYRRAGDVAAWGRMIQEEADSFYREAESESAKKFPQWFRAVHFYQAAIGGWQQLPVSVRKESGLTDKVRKAKLQLEKACQLGVCQMEACQGSSIDISKPVKAVENAVAGESVENALSIFVQLYAMKECDAERLADAFLKSSVVSALFGKSIVAGGRLVTSVSASNLDPASEEYKSRLWIEKVQRAGWLLQVACHACLMPAYQVLRKEHQLDVSNFLSLVQAAPLIPATHKRNYAEALYVGYQGLFTAACYMLAPEVENVIRNVLKSRGVVTAVQDSHTKMYQEVGLSTLVANHEADLVAAVSADFVFELKAVFTDHAGPNIRNEVAHGLKDDKTFNSTVDFYVWWFALTLVFMRPVQRA